MEPWYLALQIYINYQKAVWKQNDNNKNQIRANSKALLLWPQQQLYTHYLLSIFLLSHLLLDIKKSLL